MSIGTIQTDEYIREGAIRDGVIAQMAAEGRNKVCAVPGRAWCCMCCIVHTAAIVTGLDTAVSTVVRVALPGRLVDLLDPSMQSSEEVKHRRTARSPWQKKSTTSLRNTPRCCLPHCPWWRWLLCQCRWPVWCLECCGSCATAAFNTAALNTAPWLLCRCCIQYCSQLFSFKCCCLFSCWSNHVLPPSSALI